MTVLVSGGFDPLHDGHLDYLEGAASFGRVIVALNSDNWLMRKKGYVFMPWSARARLLKAIAAVYDVVAFDDSDDTVCEVLRSLQPNVFCNGGDRIVAEPREDAVCKELGIIQVFGVGGAKIRSSSDLGKMLRKNYNDHH